MRSWLAPGSVVDIFVAPSSVMLCLLGWGIYINEFSVSSSAIVTMVSYNVVGGTFVGLAHKARSGLSPRALVLCGVAMGTLLTGVLLTRRGAMYEDGQAVADNGYIYLRGWLLIMETIVINVSIAICALIAGWAIIAAVRYAAAK